MGRRLQSPLDRLHPDFAVADPPGCANVPRSFIPGEMVFTQNYAVEILWVRAVVVGVTEPKSYQVALDCRQIWCWNIDQLCHQAGDLVTETVPPMALAEIGQPPSTAEDQLSETGEDSPAHSPSVPAPLPESPVQPQSEAATAVSDTETSEPSHPSTSSHPPVSPTGVSSGLGSQAVSPEGPHWSNRIRTCPAFLRNYAV
ncbi:Hypothetical predicted protein [Podarcis lilfordi]|uniref:Uncharacterized protein n=1 Tax=Podarcis lilfordi TaxID=74358 RepID=A0AA35LN46_9SAUR|nr:Hypothetical predicted protein [Podarcis lilfordi]